MPRLRSVELDPFADAAAAAKARQVFELRRRRETLLGSDLFSDPAWDLLLYLFIAGSEGHSASVADACAAASVPSTTGLRWARQLEEAGLVMREEDPADARRWHLRLSGAAARRLQRLLEGASSGEQPAPQSVIKTML
jgi:DNA-binding MarR family transcriptional regulator